MARLKCDVCGRVGAAVSTIVKLTRNDYQVAYSVTSCRSCFMALDAMLEGQAKGATYGVFSRTAAGKRYRSVTGR